ncbi:hypothetical protein QC764_0029050 [Podospora pseudoanserina]|uniref:RNase III domain-containing protein n=1 Tax=Podospora pseudoanserina TaxID=2609844 RepID=A0ABR0IF44_9PEZI|nr:hypothetical protein QC764_0029050 [Podospora pseudoanserina]
MWWTKTLWWSRPWRRSGIPGSNAVPWETRWSPGSWSWSWSRRAWRAGDQAWSRGPLGIQLHWPMENVFFAPHIPCSSGASVWGCRAEPAPKFSRLATEAHCSFGRGNREDGKKLQRDCWSARRMCLEAARQTTPRPVAGHCTFDEPVPPDETPAANNTMALNPARASVSSASKALARCTRPPPSSVASSMGLSARQMSTETTPTSTPTTADSQSASGASSSERRPRWSYTPERMKGPGFSINIVKNPARKIWHVNEDPEKVDAVYNRFLGKNGDKMLPDEIKWLAVTHKSFDQGRRGFNTRLAYYGRQVLALETMRSILANPLPGDAAQEAITFSDEHGREPFQHPALANVDKLYARQPWDVVSMEKIAKLAFDVGLGEITRWKPKMPENLELSGIVSVLNTSVLAIVGAVSLQNGAEAAHRVVRDRILRRLA